MFESRRDAGGRDVWRLVLPDSHHHPAVALESGGLLAVADLVDLDLGSPVRGVGPRAGPVLPTTVPEAAVDEYGDAGASEDDVGAYGPAIRYSNREVNSVATTGAMQSAT
jgi:hypothetical protein